MRQWILLALFIIPRWGWAQPDHRYAVSLFHYNLQYVAGDYRIEQRIIRESLRPLIALLEKHPRWRIDLEIQGYAFEVLQEEHPRLLERMKRLIDRRQIELIVAHYSDQFFIAYPGYDLRKSIEISDRLLQQLGIRRSRVFSAQELQWSPALADVLHGTHDVIISSSDPHGYYRGATAPLVRVHYGGRSILVLKGGGRKKLDGLEWTWAFLDDGEDFNTRDYGSDFFRVPERERKNIEKFMRLEKEGWEFLTIGELVQRLQELPGYRIPDDPFVPEGTWNMDQGGPYMWMGRQRSGVERDGWTRALCYRARGRVLLAQRLVEWLEKHGRRSPELRTWLQKAWKHLLLAEVSDSSGWTPLLIEVRYTEEEAHKAELIAENLLQQLAPAVAKEATAVVVDTRSGAMLPGRKPSSPKPAPAHVPVAFSTRAADAGVRCEKLAPGLWRLQLRLRRPEDGAVEVAFRTGAGPVRYVPACGDSQAVALPVDLRHPPILALANGWIDLGNGFQLIKDASVRHLAATWDSAKNRLLFREELNPDEAEVEMQFYIFRGTAAAGIQLAHRVNDWPRFVLEKKNGRWIAARLGPEVEINR